MSSFNDAWTKIFDRYSILDEVQKSTFFDISAEQIKGVDGKEPRLLAKIDFREKLPDVMRENGYSLLAIKNGIYRIAKNDPFIDIPEKLQNSPKELDFPANILSLDPNDIRTESGALDLAGVSGMLAELFQDSFHLTIRGKMRGDLEFSLQNINYKVEGVQIEVDGGYETENTIQLIEAKVGYRNNINIRQLLYPQLYWEKLAKNRKKVFSYIFFLQGDIYRFLPYEYEGNKGKINYDKEVVFRIKYNGKFNQFNIMQIGVNQEKTDYNTPFPQADKFDKVDSMLLLISKFTCAKKEFLKSQFDIVDRQIDYYYNVLKWMRAGKDEGNCLILTERGSEIVSKNYKERMAAYAEIVFSNPIMYAVLHNVDIDPNEFTKYGIYSDSTIERRLQTAKAWKNYFLSIFPGITRKL